MTYENKKSALFTLDNEIALQNNLLLVKNVRSLIIKSVTFQTNKNLTYTPTIFANVAFLFRLSCILSCISNAVISTDLEER